MRQINPTTNLHIHARITHPHTLTLELCFADRSVNKGVTQYSALAI